MNHVINNKIKNKKYLTVGTNSKIQYQIGRKRQNRYTQIHDRSYMLCYRVQSLGKDRVLVVGGCIKYTIQPVIMRRVKVVILSIISPYVILNILISFHPMFILVGVLAIGYS